MQITRARHIATALVASGALALAGCGGDPEPAAIAAAAPAAQSAEGSGPTQAAQAAQAIIIDVRTPEEFAMGHLEGALNLDVEGGAFEAGLAELDPSATYIVYCRSGRRSALAAATMAAKGFTAVTDLGALEQAAAATGIPVVTG